VKVEIKVSIVVTCAKYIQNILTTITLHKLVCFPDQLKHSYFTNQFCEMWFPTWKHLKTMKIYLIIFYATVLSLEDG
jgi:hypothetical protein